MIEITAEKLQELYSNQLEDFKSGKLALPSETPIADDLSGILIASRMSLPHFGPDSPSEPKPLFIEGEFNPLNWNSGQDVIRKELTTNESMISGNCFFKDEARADFTDKDFQDPKLIEDPHIDPLIRRAYNMNAPIFSSVLNATIRKCSDWYLLIHVISMELDLYDSYIINWSRCFNRTLMIRKNEKFITLDEYLTLLKILNNRQFFNKLKWRW